MSILEILFYRFGASLQVHTTYPWFLTQQLYLNLQRISLSLLILIWGKKLLFELPKQKSICWSQLSPLHTCFHSYLKGCLLMVWMFWTLKETFSQLILITSEYYLCKDIEWISFVFVHVKLALIAFLRA